MGKKRASQVVLVSPACSTTLCTWGPSFTWLHRPNFTSFPSVWPTLQVFPGGSPDVLTSTPLTCAGRTWLSPHQSSPAPWDEVHVPSLPAFLLELNLRSMIAETSLVSNRALLMTDTVCFVIPGDGGIGYFIAPSKI